jgi:hypothetical protein
MVLRRIFGPKKNGVTTDWGELQNKDLHKFVFFAEYYYSGRFKQDEMDRTWRGIRETRNTHKHDLVGKSEREIHLQKARCRLV